MNAIKYIVLGLVFFVAVAAAWITLLEYSTDLNGNHGWHLKK